LRVTHGDRSDERCNLGEDKTRGGGQHAPPRELVGTRVTITTIDGGSSAVVVGGVLYWGQAYRGQTCEQVTRPHRL
jgi:hypothetical protein